NHPQELTENVRAAIEKLRLAGVILLSQSVLLRGINDSANTLASLFKEFLGLGIVPYYLHHPDKATGTEHFRLTIEEGKEIYASLVGQVSGHLLPKYVLDIPGGFGKVPINADWLIKQKDGSYLVRDIHGKEHEYSD
ncbi:MAG: lysine 2,3-aminomutase, partial [Pseudomonadota bacterium]